MFMFVLVEEPDGSLMLPRELDEPLDDDPLVPWSLPLQPTNKTAALAIANSFFIMVIFLCKPFHRTGSYSIGEML